MNKRNWDRLLIATLERARDHLPGPGYDEQTLATMSDPIKRAGARLGIDIDDILHIAEERACPSYDPEEDLY